MRHEDFVTLVSELVKPNIYVELGTQNGQTFNRVQVNVGEASYGVDISRDVVRHITVSDKHKFFLETTNAFAKRWKEEINKEIDLIFIDADHSKEAVLNDVSNFWPFLKADTGIMILHDTWPTNKEFTAPDRCGDCYLAIKEIKKMSNCELFTLPSAHGLTFIRKASSDWRNG